jgi:O-antigen/teichoic acid export membrane protein
VPRSAGLPPFEQRNDMSGTAQLPERYGRSVAASYVNTLVAALAALIVTPVLARGLGPEQYGIWVLVASFALYLELLEFGFGGATIKYVAEAWARRDREGVARVIATSFWILAAAGLGALALGAVLAVVFPNLFGVSGQVAHDARILVALVMFELALSIPLDTFGGVLIALQRLDLMYGSLMVVSVLQAVAWTVIIALGGGLVELGIATVALGLLGQLARLSLARGQTGGVFVSPRLFDRSRVRKLAGFSAWASVNEVSSVVVQRLDTVIVGVLLGVPAAGVYAVGQRLARLGAQAVQPLATVFFAHSSSLTATRDRSAVSAAFVAGTRLSLGVAAPILLALALLAEPTIDAWVGDNFSAAGGVVVFLSLAALVSSFSDVANLITQGIGTPKLPAVARLMEAILNLALSVVLAKLIGIEGVAIATLVAAAVTQLLYFLPRACRQLEVHMGRLIWSLLRAHALPAAAAAGVGVAALELGVSGIAAVVVADTLIVVVYAAVFYRTGMNAEERRFTIARLRDIGGQLGIARP